MPDQQKAQSLKLTVLVDNLVDIFLPPDDGPCIYPKAGPCSSLWAEQGLSLWLEVTGSQGAVKVLHDFGRGGPVLSHNLKILMPDGPQPDLLVLSHGHVDHYGGLNTYLDEGGRPAPLITHPESFGSRGIRLPSGGLAGPWVFEKEPLLERGLEVVTTYEARQLGPGLWSTGSIARNSRVDVLLDRAVRWDDKGCITPDALQDDQALVICLDKLGLVVITGCCHAGVMNTLDAAAALFPGEPLYALIGGLHLNHLNREQARNLAEEVAKRNPQWVLPLHCTGAMAIRTLHEVLGERCLANTVGLRLELKSN